MRDVLQPKGRFVIEHYRDGKLLKTYDFPNGITNEGKNRLLNNMFESATAITSWYIGLIDNAGGPVLAAADTYVNINQVGNAWTEFTSYTVASAAVRAAWAPAASTAQVSSNAVSLVYDITASGTVYGGFVVGGPGTQNVLGDHSAGGVLWSTAANLSGGVPSPIPVNLGDQLKLTYSVSA